MESKNSSTPSGVIHDFIIITSLNLREVKVGSRLTRTHHDLGLKRGALRIIRNERLSMLLHGSGGGDENKQQSVNQQS